MPLLLGVNIDHVATLRQARYAGSEWSHNAEPSPLEAAHDALAGGADSITVHVRGDRRHMQEADVVRIRAEVPLPLNFEMGVTDQMLAMAGKIRPDFACLVPETRQEITTEGGLDVSAGFSKVGEAVKMLQGLGIVVSLFIDPDEAQVEAAARCAVDMIELHTGCFANAEGDAVGRELKRLRHAAVLAHGLGLRVNAGHGINYHNIASLLSIPHLAELNIGHSIIARSLKVGLTTAVAEMKKLMESYELS
ncbi:MAG: pyridoxine 5'-phosphate synthase [Luteolibacter sp.]